MNLAISRRLFLQAASLPLMLSAAKPDRSEVGCQANAWPLKPDDFPGLLEVFRKSKELGYVGCECNVRFVQDQFARTAEARKEIDATGIQYIGAHTSMANSKAEGFARTAANVAALGALRIVMSGTGLSPEGNFEPAALKVKAAELERLGKV